MQVELPLGATEDRICGTIDIEKALQEGIKAYEPGLLVKLHGIFCCSASIPQAFVTCGMQVVEPFPAWQQLGSVSLCCSVFVLRNTAVVLLAVLHSRCCCVLAVTRSRICSDPQPSKLSNKGDNISMCFSCCSVSFLCSHVAVLVMSCAFSFCLAVHLQLATHLSASCIKSGHRLMRNSLCQHAVVCMQSTALLFLCSFTDSLCHKEHFRRPNAWKLCR